MPRARKAAEPKYRTVVSALRDQIRQKADVGRLSESGIMQEFAVGRNTAVKALNLLESQGWVRRVSGSGTFPVQDGSKALRSINVLFTDGMLTRMSAGGLRAFLALSPLRGIFSWPQIDQCFVKIVFVRLEESLAAKKEKILSLGPRSGLIIPTHMGFEDIIDICRRNRFPYIVSAPAGMDFNSVSMNHYAGMAKAVHHLITHSRRRHILLVIAGRQDLWYKPRYDAYVDVLQKNGLRPREDLVLTLEPGAAASAERLRNTLKEQPKIDAIISTSCLYFTRIAQALRDLEMRIPKDKAVVVYDDPPELSEFDPPITAVRTPLLRVGEVLAEKIVEMIDFGFRDDYRIVLDGELVIREST